MIKEIPAYRLGLDYVGQDDGTTAVFRSLAPCCVPFDVPVANLALCKDGRELARFQDGRLWVWEGYTWDGCSPKVRLAVWVYGTPDPPCTRLASKVHDLLYTFLMTRGFPFTRKQCDDAFFDIMRLSGFRFPGLYHYAVKLFGGRFAAPVEGTEIRAL